MESSSTGGKDSTNSRCMVEIWRNRMSGQFRLFVKEPPWYRRYQSFLLCLWKRPSAQVLSTKHRNRFFSTNTLRAFPMDRVLHDLKSQLERFRIQPPLHSHTSSPTCVADHSLRV